MCIGHKVWLLAAVGLLVLVSLTPGCGPPKHVFQKYDFSFEYRADTEMTREKGSATEGSFEWWPDTTAMFELNWYKVSEQPEGVKNIMEESVKGSSQAAKAWAEVFVMELEGSLQRAIGVPVEWAIAGQPASKVMGGYKVSYQLVRSQPTSLVHGLGICAIWYCESIDKLFVLQIAGKLHVGAQESVAYDTLKDVERFVKAFKTEPS